MTAMFFRYSLICLLGAFFSFEALSNDDYQSGAPVVIANTVEIPFTSEVNGMNYVLQIAYPETASSKSKYPVIYLLDGNDDFPFLTSVARRLQLEDGLKPSIIVGIGYQNSHRLHRRQDYTPSRISQVSNSGGASQFARVLSEEILPLIHARFPVLKDENALFGNSLGGLFSASLLLNGSNLFRHYVISSPSTWWDGYHIFNTNTTKVKQSDRKVLITVGESENPHMIESWLVLSDFIEDNNWASLTKRVKLSDENHTTAKYRAYVTGLKWLYRN